MAPRNRNTNSSAASPSAASSSHSATSAASQPVRSSSSTSRAGNQANVSNAQDVEEIVRGVWTNYLERTPLRMKLIDAFMAFLVVVGGLQFVYCVVAGSYPFNAFLSGFSATVGQFVLTASLRMQTNTENKAEFVSISPERAFADYVFGSLLLHFFCINFIN